MPDTPAPDKFTGDQAEADAIRRHSGQAPPLTDAERARLDAAFGVGKWGRQAEPDDTPPAGDS
jgi:hypothetical protein